MASAIPIIPTTATMDQAGIDESRAKRRERQQARLRDRGGIYVPQERNILLDILCGKAPPLKPASRRSRSRSISVSPKKPVRASSKKKARKSVAKKGLADLEGSGADSQTTSKPKASSRSKTPTKSKASRKSTNTSKPGTSSRSKSQEQSTRVKTTTTRPLSVIAEDPEEEVAPIAGPSTLRDTTTTAQPSELSWLKRKASVEDDTLIDSPPPKRKRAHSRKDSVVVEATAPEELEPPTVAIETPVPPRSSQAKSTTARKSRKQKSRAGKDADTLVDNPPKPKPKKRAAASTKPKQGEDVKLDVATQSSSSNDPSVKPALSKKRSRQDDAGIVLATPANIPKRRKGDVKSTSQDRKDLPEIKPGKTSKKPTTSSGKKENTAVRVKVSGGALKKKPQGPPKAVLDKLKHSAPHDDISGEDELDFLS